MILVIGIVLALTVVPDAWDIPVVLGFGALEVVETLVTWRLSRRGAAKVGAETLIGATGLVVSACAPAGSVRVRGEVWQARSEHPIAADQRARVVGRDGLTLLVEPA